MTAVMRKWIRIFGACLFGVYVAGLIYFLFLAEGYGRGMNGAVYDYNIYPFREIRRYLTWRQVLGIRAVLLNLAGNVIGFIPFGTLLPLIVRSARKAWKVTLLGFEISLLVEISQLLFQVGCFDVDDIILNTLGALFGYLVYALTSRLYILIERKNIRKRGR